MSLAIMVVFLMIMVVLGFASLYIVCCMVSEFIREVYDFEN